MELFNPIVGERFDRVIARMKNEYEAHYLYDNCANYCENVGYDKAAKFFREEAKSELKHALKLKEYLNKYGVPFTTPTPIVTPVINSLADCVYKGYGIEVTLYKEYNADAISVMHEDTSLYMLFCEMVNIQFESVAEYRTLIDKLALYNDDATGIKLFEQEAF